MAETIDSGLGGHDFLEGGGACGALIRGRDWTTTPLGPPEAWPESLKTLIRLILASQQPMFIAWGPALNFLYNDAYAPVLGAKHPDMGRPFAELWADIWPQFGPIVDQTLAGEGVNFEDLPIPMRRNGVLEDTWFSFSYTPVRDEAGTVQGVFCACLETTASVRARQARDAAEGELRGSEQRIRAFVNASSDIMYRAAPDWSELRLLEGGRIDAAGATSSPNWIDDFLLAEERAEIERRIGDAIRDKAPYQYEHRIRRRTGEIGWIHSRAVPLLGEDGEIREWFGAAADTTERKRAEEALREETRILETLNAVGEDLAGELDLETVVQRVTDAGVELTGAQFGAFFYNVINRAGESYMLYTLSGVDRSHFEQFPMPRNTPVFGPTFRGEGVVRSDDILADPRYGTMDTYGGMPPGHLPVRSYLAVPVTSRSGEVIGGLFFGHEETGRFEARHERLMVGVAGQAAVALDNARLFQAVQRELDERRVTEAALRESEADYRAAAELNPQVAWTALPDGRLDRVASRWKEWTGLSGLGASWGESLLPEDLGPSVEAWSRALAAGEPYDIEHRVVRTDGEVRWLRSRAFPRRDETGRIVRWYGATEDIHEQKTAELALQRLNESLEAEVEARSRDLRAAEESLRQAQKMEAVGQLTGGIAHDFNNLLTGIIGALDLMKRRIDAGRLTEIDRFMDAATTSANRAAALTHRLLAFARRQSLDVKPTDVNALVASVEELLQRTLGERFEISFELQPGLWLATTDSNQLETALLNLAINARDAMPEGGKLTIETANTSLDDAYVRQYDGLAAGDYVALCVTDTGVGMDAETVARAFDPFFTTKPLGQGTGLGLSMIYGFVRQAGGHARIYSEPGQGTTVKLYLPRSDAAAAETDTGGAMPIARGSGETVLVVEDDPAVRMLVLEVLPELGYRTLEAHDGLAALPILDGPEPIDLLVSDVGLPGLNGRQLAEQARQRRPGLKVLFITGYAENAVVRSGFLDAGMEMITKPFPVDALAAKVKEMLGGA